MELNDNIVLCSEDCGGIGQYVCSTCQRVKYCSQVCQQRAWDGHQKDCISADASDMPPLLVGPLPTETPYPTENCMDTSQFDRIELSRMFDPSQGQHVKKFVPALYVVEGQSPKELTTWGNVHPDAECLPKGVSVWLLAGDATLPKDDRRVKIEGPMTVHQVMYKLLHTRGRVEFPPVGSATVSPSPSPETTPTGSSPIKAKGSPMQLPAKKTPEEEGEEPFELGEIPEGRVRAFCAFEILPLVDGSYACRALWSRPFRHGGIAIFQKNNVAFDDSWLFRECAVNSTRTFERKAGEGMRIHSSHIATITLEPENVEACF